MNTVKSLSAALLTAGILLVANSSPAAAEICFIGTGVCYGDNIIHVAANGVTYRNYSHPSRSESHASCDEYEKLFDDLAAHIMENSQGGMSVRFDVNKDGVVNVADLAAVTDLKRQNGCR